MKNYKEIMNVITDVYCLKNRKFSGRSCIAKLPSSENDNNYLIVNITFATNAENAYGGIKISLSSTKAGFIDSHIIRFYDVWENPVQIPNIQYFDTNRSRWIGTTITAEMADSIHADLKAYLENFR